MQTIKAEYHPSSRWKQNQMVIKILGLLLVLFSLSMLLPMAVATIYHEDGLRVFLLAFVASAGTGFLMWLSCFRCRMDLDVRHGFLVVMLFWFVLSCFGAIPFYLNGHVPLHMIDAWFESVSGLTTTGASIIKDLSRCTHALLFYRQELQFLGGMGIIVLAVAILPMLGVGGMQMYRAEIPGPVKEYKLTPRMTETAKSLWMIYLTLALLCMTFYYFAGMKPFDALLEGMSTVATGGFSVHNTSFAYYHNRIINMGACFFMLMSSVNFGLHYFSIKRCSLRSYYEDMEVRVLALIIMVVTIIVYLNLYWSEPHHVHHHLLADAFFAVVSMATTTGLVFAHFAIWPTFLPFLFLLIALVGGCAASTSGGIKIVRFVLLFKQGAREVHRLLHPHGVFVIKMGQKKLPEKVIMSITGFLSMFFLLYFLEIILLLATGLDFLTAVGATTSTLSNVGASVGQVANNYASLSVAAKSILIVSMMAGRLEVFTLLVLLSPDFWNR